MKARILVGAIILALLCPPVSHGIGLLKYALDGISNQLGFGRGPIPKVFPPPLPPVPVFPPPLNGSKRPPHPGQRFRIQAEGF